MSFPCFHQRQGRDIALAGLPSSIVRELAEVCREAWHGGMLAGCNGNASCRWQSPEGERIVITRSGAAKGRLTLRDLCVLDARSGATLYGGPSSSEGLMHLEVYAARPQCGAILHTHPRRLLALALKLEVALAAELPGQLFQAALHIGPVPGEIPHQPPLFLPDHTRPSFPYFR